MRCNLLNEFGEFPVPDEHPMTRYVPAIKHPVPMPRLRPKDGAVDATLTRAQILELMTDYSLNAISRELKGSVCVSTLSDIYSGRRKCCSVKTANEVDKMYRRWSA